MLCWSDISFPNIPGEGVGGSRLGSEGRRVSYGQCGCETCCDVAGRVVQGSRVDGGTMSASTPWLQKRLDEVDGNGRGWVSGKASPSTPVCCCFCSHHRIIESMV